MLIASLLAALSVSSCNPQQPHLGAVLPAVGEALDVEPVWAAHPVGFALWTEAEQQFVAYYDAERRMSVAQRRLDQREWRVTKLGSTLGWDSHNYVTMAVDRRGFVHVAGNMHAAPLVYFRSERQLDAASLIGVHRMVGSREQRVTYPVFLEDRDGRLVFRYRDGGSGNGDDVLDLYDDRGQRWQRLTDEALLGGGGKVNGYFSAPERGPDGWFHIVGIWRDTPDCATNHDVCYARSKDLVRWQRADGKRLPLPLTPDAIDVVDPVPAGGGAINGNVKLGFDAAQRPIVSYHKFDERGHTAIYCARFEGKAWRVRKVGDFGDYRWQFGGGGSIVFEVHVSAVRELGDGTLAQDASFPGGARHWLLDGETLEVRGEAAPPPPSLPLPPDLAKVPSSFPGLQRRHAADRGRAPDGVRHALVWATLPQNRDRPRQGPLPEPTMLRLVALPPR